MPRIFVYGDNLDTRAEVITERPDGYAFACAGCHATEDRPTEAGIARFEDATEVAGLHVDRCKRCANGNCLIAEVHDSGRRCRYAGEGR